MFLRLTGGTHVVLPIELLIAALFHSLQALSRNVIALFECSTNVFLQLCLICRKLCLVVSLLYSSARHPLLKIVAVDKPKKYLNQRYPLS